MPFIVKLRKLEYNRLIFNQSYLFAEHFTNTASFEF